MFVEFHTIEESLKSFLMEAQDDNSSSRNAKLYKYNNLKVYMDPKKSSTPHVIIRVGISEAVYDFKNWEKISGGLGSDEKYLKKWIERNIEHFDFQTLWIEAKKPKPVVMRSDDTDFSEE